MPMIVFKIFGKEFHISNLHEKQDKLVYGFSDWLRGKTFWLDAVMKLRRGWLLARSLEWLNKVPIDDYLRPGND
jgi:hypothetical protein